MPPDSPMTTSVKPFFVDVVAGAEHERLVDLVDRGRAAARSSAAAMAGAGAGLRG